MPAEIKGALELRKALREFSPDLAKETRKEIAGILKPIAKEAKGFVPSNEEMISGWTVEKQKGAWERVAYDAAAVKRGIGYKTSPSKANRQGWRSIASILNKSAAGSIYETAGRKTNGQQGASVNRNAGQEFIAELNKTGRLVNADNQKRVGRHSNKSKGRAMFRAVAEDEGKTTAAVMKALEKASAKFKGASK